ncbi:unnamed protein product [Symbiodinium sp. CCMP2592]|nr:unnamed protein product [Symbiodinium sp. CCMP2592]
MSFATASRRSDEDSDGADTNHLYKLENLLQAGEYLRDDDLWPAYMRCIAVSLVQFACAPVVFVCVCACSGRVTAAGMTIGFMLIGSTAFQYSLADTLVSWLQRQPCRASWQHSIDALADFGSTCSMCCFLSHVSATMFGMIEAIDPALDAWAAANAFNLYTDDLRLKFESTWNHIPLLGWLVAYLGLPGVLLSILLFSMLCQLWSLYEQDQHVTTYKLFDKFMEGAETGIEHRYKLWYEWKHVSDLGGLLVLLRVFEKLVYAELELDTNGALYPLVDRFWSFVPKVLAEALPSLWFQVSVIALTYESSSRSVLAINVVSVASSVFVVGRSLHLQLQTLVKSWQTRTCSYFTKPRMLQNCAAWLFSFCCFSICLIRLAGLWICPGHVYSLGRGCFDVDHQDLGERNPM